VVNFQNKTPAKVAGIGEAAAEILGTILQKTERFIVIPQQTWIPYLRSSGRVRPAPTTRDRGKDGRDHGPERDRDRIDHFLFREGKGYDYLVSKGKKQIASVTVDYRVVDTTTGVQLLADSGAGIYEKKISSVLGMGTKPR